MTSFEAYTPARPTPVRTFNARDLAEAYAERMRALGAEIIIKRAYQRRSAA